jgi:SPP1 gp7 family putative phage head morphogenesis protein
MPKKIRPVDPTYTSRIRLKLIQDVRKRFKELKKAIHDIIIKEDAFGLVNVPPDANLLLQFSNGAASVRNTRWAFRTDSEKVEEFQKWMTLQLASKLDTNKRAEDAFWYSYIKQGYDKGQGNSLKDFYKGRGASLSDIAQLTHFQGTRKQFLEQSFGSPVSLEKVKLLAGRTLTDLKGVTEAMSTQMSRELVEGLTQGKSPREVAKDIEDRVDKIGKVRSETIARTEIIRAHAEGQLDALEKMGIDSVTAAVEWSTALDNNVCPLCQPLEGMVLKINEARGMLPRHPNCRCAWRPANVGESQDKQKRTKAQISTALKRSRKAEGKKSTFSAKISSKRPKDILDTTDTPKVRNEV